MKKDMNDMKQLVNDLMKNGSDPEWKERNAHLINNIQTESPSNIPTSDPNITIQPKVESAPMHHHEEVEESLSLQDKEKEFIQKALTKYKGRRKMAAKELGISERTLYRKMNEYGIH